MKHWLAGVCFALASLSATADLQAVSPSMAMPAGESVLAGPLADRRGSAVIVNFWASWCEPCREEMPALQRLAERWRTRGVTVITVAVADRGEKAADFLWETGATLPLLRDTEQKSARAWGVRSLPTTLVLDRNHRIVGRARGAFDWDAGAADTQLQNLLK